VSTDITPWWTALKIRPEIVNASGQIDDVQMSLFQAVYGQGDMRPEYADAAYYGEITYPTGTMVDLFAKLAVRLGGGDDYKKARALWRLDQGMGGGKSHASIGAYHLAENPEALFKTELGKKVREAAKEILGSNVSADLDGPKVVVLPLDNMTPGAGVQEYDGPAVNLYERFLWRLFDKDYARYEAYRPFFSSKEKIADALRSLNRPVLILIDEIMDYIRALDGVDKPDLAEQDMAFIRALLDTVNDVPHVAAVVVMIASDKDTMAVSTKAAERREEIASLLERNGSTTPVNENADFAAILRRRLFTQAAAREVVSATTREFAKTMKDQHWSGKVFDGLGAPWVKNFDAEVQRTYPFHPQLMALAEGEWANMAGFQKVRSTILVFAAAAYALAQRGTSGEWAPLLIGPGDLPLSDATVREAIINSGLISDTRTQANYRSLAQNEVVGLDDASGTARLLDLQREGHIYGTVNPRAAERAATMIFLASIVGSRGQGHRGATELEAMAATFVPTATYGYGDADSLIKGEITNSLASLDKAPGKGGQPPRYFLSTERTLQMMARAAGDAIRGDEDLRDQTVYETALALASDGGRFNEVIGVQADPNRSPLDVLTTAEIEKANSKRLVILDPAQFTLKNGAEKSTVAAVEAVLGVGPDKVPTQWAASVVFAVATTQGRKQARQFAVEYLAWDRVSKFDDVKSDPDLAARAKAETDERRTKFRDFIKQAFRHVAYLAQPADQRVVEVKELGDLRSSLDGGAVWKELAEVDKAYEPGTFTAKALMHQLRDPEDYGIPLREIRDAFWSAPRLPLLPRGEADLREAIFSAIQAGDLVLTDANGVTSPVTSPGEINLSGDSRRLGKPGPATCPNCGQPAHEGPCDTDTTATCPKCGRPAHDGPCDTDTTATCPKCGKPAHDGPCDTGPTPPQPSEKQVNITFVGDINPTNAEGLAKVLLDLYTTIDNGDASYLNATIQIVADAAVADQVVHSAQQAGLNSSSKML
jgi:hypothetical protein